MRKLNKKIIAIVGMVGAGKSETARIFSENKIPVIRFGNVTDEIINQKNLPKNETSERAVREDLRKKNGMAVYAKLNNPKIKQILSLSDTVVLDGLYSMEEYTYLSKYYSSIILLCIYARPEIRYRRVSKRRTRSLNLNEAKERDLIQILNLNKAGPIAMADFLIENDGNKKLLKSKIEEFINGYIRKS